jgi:predicted metal-dependent peptidase
VTISTFDRIKKARTVLLLDHPFFGALIFRLRLVPAPGIPTMATDGSALYYNPAFVDSLTPSQLVGCLAHEVMHPGLQHHTRRGDRDPRAWNEAADLAINPLLLDAGLDLPDGVLVDDQYRGMSAEQIFNLRDQSCKQKQNQGQNDPSSSPSGNDAADGQSGASPSPGTPDPHPVESQGGFGQVMDAPNPEAPGQPLSEAQRSIEEAEWRAAVEMATIASTMAGKLPAGLERSLKEANSAKVDWRDQFRRAFAGTIPNDYSWAKPNRRYLHAGLYLPGIQKNGIGEIAIAVDCSGSVSERELGQFSAEINTLVAEHSPETVHVLYFDSKVQRYDRYSSGETVSLTPTGGGGTDFAPVIHYLEEQGTCPHVLIYLTDLEGHFPDVEPDYPVIWVSTSRQTAPFGETIHIDAA